MVQQAGTGAYDDRVEKRFKADSFKLALSMGSEGTNYDRKLDGKVAKPERSAIAARYPSIHPERNSWQAMVGQTRNASSHCHMPIGSRMALLFYRNSAEAVSP